MIIKEIISNPPKFFFENFGLKQTILKNTFWLTLAEIITRFLKFILIIYVARIFGATEYGKFNFALSFVSFFAIFSDLGIPQIFVRDYGNNEKRDEDFYNLFSLRIFLIVITLFLILIITPLITEDIYIRKIMILLAAFSLFNSFSGIFFTLFQAKQKMEYQAFFQIMSAILTAIFGFFVVFKMPSASNLAHSYLFASLVTAIFILLFFYLRKIPLAFRINKTIWKKYIILSWPLALTGAFLAIWGNADTMMMGAFGQITQVGWYQAAYKIIGVIFIPASLISASFFPALSLAFKESKERFIKIWNYFLRIMISLAVLIVIGGLVLSSKMINWLYGSEYFPSILAIRLLLIMAGLSFASLPFSQLFILLNQQKKLFWITIFCSILNVIINIFLIPRYSLYGAAVATTIVSFVYFCCTSIIAKNVS